MTEEKHAGDRNDALLDMDAIRALYLHIPFCASRCNYCDFSTEACPADDPLVRDYVFALSFLARTSAVAGTCGDVETFYLGGGTPSHVGNRNLSSLLYLLSTRMNLEDGTEFTLELNPESFDRSTFKDLWALGVNRYSVGVQSFDDEVLGRLGRIHDSARSEEVVSMLSERDANVSVDLMCGIPGQSRESFLDDVAHAIELGVKHVSVYPLTIEEGTPFAHDVASGAMEAPDDDLQADEMLAAAEMLASAGFERYETANFARAGFRSRHNLAYWTGKEYLGLGTSAASMLSPTSFRTLVEAGVFVPEDDPVDIPEDAVVRTTVVSPTDEIAHTMHQRVRLEVLTHERAVAEQVMLRMRLSDGISDGLLDAGCDADPALRETFDRLVEQGLVVHESHSFHTTTRGWLLGNVVFGAIWDTVSARG
jgi:oxygen-independent coproporphyrinogen-3 oxidase